MAEPRAIAIANNDLVYLWWTYPKKIPDCLGFSVQRIEDGRHKALPAFVRFGAPESVATTDRARGNTDWFPIQSYQWKDLTVPPETEVTYRIVPMTGTPGEKLVEVADQAITAGPVTATRHFGGHTVVFNRGIISTQGLRRLLDTPENRRPDQDDLLRRVATPGDLVRDRLTGDALDTLVSLLLRARREGGRCLCALYELSDPELVDELRACVGHVEVILSAAERIIYDGANSGMRHRLRRAIGNDLHDRMLSDGHLGHNKFVVYLDSDGKPQSVLTGSTNWTATGLCTQTNNVLVIDEPEVAARFHEQWKALLAEGAEQSKALRDSNAKPPPDQSLGAGNGTVRVWFSPNMRTSSFEAETAKTPPDMQQLFELIENARDGVMFLVFNPGSVSILNRINKVAEERREAGKRFFVRGAISDAKVAASFTTRVYNDSMLEAPNQLVSGIGAVHDRYAYWEAELLKVGHAAIHDKILVVDPFGAGCAVATGSHNLGFKASYANDENLCIIRENPAIARAYAAHVLDVVNHFNWRAKLGNAATSAHLDDEAAEHTGDNPFVGLATDDQWQNKYFRGHFLANRDKFFFPE